MVRLSKNWPSYAEKTLIDFICSPFYILGLYINHIWYVPNLAYISHSTHKPSKIKAMKICFLHFLLFDGPPNVFHCLEFCLSYALYKDHIRYFLALKTLLDKVTDEEVEKFSGELEVIYILKLYYTSGFIISSIQAPSFWFPYHSQSV